MIFGGRKLASSGVAEQHRKALDRRLEVTNVSIRRKPSSSNSVTGSFTSVKVVISEPLVGIGEIDKGVLLTRSSFDVRVFRSTSVSTNQPAQSMSAPLQTADRAVGAQRFAASLGQPLRHDVMPALRQASAFATAWRAVMGTGWETV